MCYGIPTRPPHHTSTHESAPRIPTPAPYWPSFYNWDHQGWQLHGHPMINSVFHWKLSIYHNDLKFEKNRWHSFFSQHSSISELGNNEWLDWQSTPISESWCQEITEPKLLWKIAVYSSDLKLFQRNTCAVSVHLHIQPFLSTCVT